MIKEITITAGGNILSKYSGEYMANLIHRDETDKKILINKMIGNIPELYDPKKYNGGHYPNSVIYNDNDDIQPSIKGRKLYIPLMAWFCNSTKNALPLIALQYQEVFINIEFRPVKELFTILDVDGSTLKQPTPTTNVSHPYFYDTNTIINSEGKKVEYRTINNNYRKSPNKNWTQDQFYRFIQKPPKLTELKYMDSSDYKNKNRYWSNDIHLVGTYVFLDNDERTIMASKKHKFLIKSCYEEDFPDITGSRRIKIPSKDMVSSYMWRFRRDDVGDRNQWHNYQNFSWENVIPRDVSSIIDITDHIEIPKDNTNVSPPDSGNNYNLHLSPKLNEKYLKNIMSGMAILCGDEYRENTLDSGVYEFIENWYRSTGVSKDGLYLYNFCINSNRLTYQPTGAQNTNKWQHVVFEIQHNLTAQNR